jgi:hypothetical protein
MPCLQSPPDRTKIKLLEKDTALFHCKQDLSANLLVLKAIAVRSLNALVLKVFGHTLRRPCHDLFFCVKLVFLVVGLLAGNV